MFDWRIQYLFFRFDTCLVLSLGALFMVSVAKWGPLRGGAGDAAELSYSLVWPLSFPFWTGFAYADGISLPISPFIALAYGAGFALGALRRSRARTIRAIACVSLGINLLFVLASAIGCTTRFL